MKKEQLPITFYMEMSIKAVEVSNAISGMG